VASVDSRIRTALWALAGLALAVGISLTAFAVAGGTIGEPASTVRVVPSLDEQQGGHTPKPTHTDGPSDTPDTTETTSTSTATFTSTSTAQPSGVHDGGGDNGGSGGTHDGSDD
jgi:hypothetical protein